MTEDEELAHLRAPSRDPQQRNIDYWARRAERAEADNERLRADNELLAAAHGRPSWRAYEAITAKQMTMDEARRVASSIAKLPEMLKRGN